MSVSIEQMIPKLFTLDQAIDRLATTEPLKPVQLAGGPQISFQLDPGWNHDLENVKDSDPVKAYVNIGQGPSAEQYQLSKLALLEAASFCGLPKVYVQRTPGQLIEPHLNFWYRGGFDDKAYQLLAVGEEQLGMSVTKASLHPFSNLRLLESAVKAITKKYGEGAIYADYKFPHSLNGTHLRLVLPEQTRVITNSGTDDDIWSVGVQFSNSQSGREVTEVTGYLFRWTCTNGQLAINQQVGRWSRKTAGQGDDVYAWAAESVDEVLGGLEGALDEVQALTEISVANDTEFVLRDLFDQYKIPSKERMRIIGNMVEDTELTMYSVLAAITEAANTAEASQATKLMSIGGDLAHQASDRCGECRRLLPH